MDQILLINKPKGISSAQVVNLVKQKYKVKVGHAGTLDPQASGLLIVLTGKKTKEASHFLKLPKIYEVEAILGIKTDTFDLEGRILQTNLRRVSRLELEQVLKKFQGEIWQTPPLYSAKKIKGQPAYKLARRGQKIILKPQKVTIYSLKLLSFRYPEFKLILNVSSGFYVRSFINEIGIALGVGATVKNIKRLAIGPYHLDEAQTLEAILDKSPR